VIWPLRKAVWNGLAVFKFRVNKPVRIPVPRGDGRRLQAVSLASQFPEIPIANIRVADAVPDDEASRPSYYFYALQVALYRWFSPMQAGLPPIDADPAKALDHAYTAAHRRCFPRPVLPDEYARDVDLGRLAVASPYACYLERGTAGGYEWDLTALARYPHHPGLRSLGVRVRFDVHERTRQLVAEAIECELGVCTPGSPQWDAARKLALCAATTHVSLVRHFNWAHLAAGGPFAMATRNSLPADHPVRRMLWPHMFRTQYSNQLVTKGQMVPGGDFETIFSFTHAGMCALFTESYEQFDIRVLDPVRDAERRGLSDAPFDQPALTNRRAHFDVMHEHALRYLGRYYTSDLDVQKDANVTAWLHELDRLIPNGVRRLAGEAPTLTGMARLCAAFIYMATVEHEVLGTGLWNYQMWTQIQPVRVYRNAMREPLDVYQRLVNANFNLNVHRTQLLEDFSYLALDAAGAEAFREFRAALGALQRRIDAEPAAPWKVSPSILEASINA
jgi:arachidonate 15-lipoxygenase